MGFEGLRRTRMIGSDNDITIQCTIEYKTRDEGHENNARLSQILVDDGTVISQGFYMDMVGQWQATVGR
jgi:hypothetical protein